MHGSNIDYIEGAHHFVDIDAWVNFSCISIYVQNL